MLKFIISLICVSHLSFAQFTSSNLPIVLIETNGDTIVNDPKITVNLKILYHSDNSTNYLTDTDFHYNGFAGIEYRGSSSQTFPKKSYSIELIDNLGKDLDFPMFGFPKGSDWALIANYDDKTYLRNAYVYDLWSKTGNYSPRLKHVEVVLNGEYMGLFVFTERIKRGTDRINIKKLDKEDTTTSKISGGYIIEASRESEILTSDYAWQSSHQSSPASNYHMYFDCVYPKEPVAPQLNYIQTYIRDFEDALKSANFSDPVLGFRNYIDENSFVENFVLQEYSIHLDIFARSQYFYKDRGKKMVASPLWDTSLGLYDTYTTSWRFSCGVCDPRFFWAERMMQDCVFKNKVIEKYKDFRKTILTYTKGEHFIDSLANVLQTAAARDREKWFPAESLSFTDEIQKLKNFISNRINWMDNNIHNITNDGNILAAPSTANANQSIELVSTCASRLVTWKFENNDGTSGYFTDGNPTNVVTSQTVTYTAICQEVCPQYTNSKTIVVNNNCPDSIDFTSHIINPPIQEFNTKYLISSTASLNSSSKIEYLAGGSIELNPGFQTTNGTVFLAKIEGCQ